MAENQQNNTPMRRLMRATEGQPEALADIIAGVLEYLSTRAAIDAPFKVVAEDGQAIVVVAANDDVEPVLNGLPDNVRNWNDPLDPEVLREVSVAVYGQPEADEDRNGNDNN